MTSLSSTSLFLLSSLATSNAFYVPGVAPTDYTDQQVVDIRAVKLTSSKTQLPYEYFTLPMCKPAKVDYRMVLKKCHENGKKLRKLPFYPKMI